MNTHDIENLLDRMEREGSTPLDWPEYYAARAAIEAERKRGGEPTTNQDLDLSTLPYTKAERRKLLGLPPLDETVKEPSDDDLISLALEVAQGATQEQIILYSHLWVRLCRLALSRHGQPAQPDTYKDSTPDLSVGDSSFESWYSGYNPAGMSDKQRARDAYAAGMGDPLVSYAQPAASAEPDVVLRVVHSEHEVEEPEILTTSRRFDSLPHWTEVKLYATPIAAQPSATDT